MTFLNILNFLGNPDQLGLLERWGNNKEELPHFFHYILKPSAADGMMGNYFSV